MHVAPLGLILFLALIPAAFAEENLGELSLEELSQIKVVTATKSEQEISSAPATVYAFTDQMITQRGYRNLAELLGDIPEIEVNARGSIEPYNLPTIRGINSVEKSLVILQDGVRITSIAGSPTATQFNFPLDYAKRVEVLIGPSSAIYGADAFSGVVNIITKDADDLKGGSVTGSFGRFTTTDNSAIYGDTFGDFKLVFHASQYYSSDPFFPDYYPAQYAGYFNYQDNGTVLGSNGSPTTVPIQPYSASTKAYTFGGKVNFRDLELGYNKSYSSASSSLGTLPEKSLYVDSARIIEEIQAIYGKHTYRSEDEKLTIASQLYHGSQSMEPDSRYVNTFDNYTGGYKYEIGNCFEWSEDVFYRFEKWYQLTTGLLYQDFSVLPRTPDLPAPYDTKIGSGSQGFTFPGTTIPIPYYTVFYQNYGIFGQLQARLSPTVELTAGTRYDYNTRFGGSLNPRVATTLSSGGDSARLVYAEAYHAPEPYTEYTFFGGFTTTGGTPTGGFFNIPNPNLQPEKLRSIEADFTHLLTPDLSVSTDVFMNWVTDNTANSPLPPGTTFAGVPVSGVQRVNSGLLRSYGGTIRWDATLSWGSVFIRPTIAYTLIKGDLNQMPLPNAAENTVKAAITFTRGKLSVFPHYEFRSKSYTPDQVSYAPSYGVVNLALRYDNVLATQRYPLAVFVNFRNLLDRRYGNSSDVTGANFASVPQDPIRVEGGGTLSF